MNAALPQSPVQRPDQSKPRGSLARIAIVAPLAVVVTVGLIAGMRALIASDATPAVTMVDVEPFVIAEHIDPVTLKPIELPDAPEFTPAPPRPAVERPSADRPEEGLDTLIGALPDLEPTALEPGPGLVSPDRDAEPAIRIPPSYPPRAASRGVEGGCTIQFDVTPSGVPANVTALSCSSALFERSALHAVQRWRYDPKIENGVAVWRYGVQTRLDYALEG